MEYDYGAVSTEPDAIARSQEGQKFLLKLSDALRPLTQPVAIQDVAARILGEHLGCAWTYYGEFDAALTQMTVKRCYVLGDAPSLAGVHPIDSFAFHAPLRSGTAIAVADMQAHPMIGDGSRARFGALGMRSFAAAPILTDGVLRAIIVVADPITRSWSDHEIRLLEEVVERTWSAVEHARAEEALRESESKYRSLFEIIEEAYALSEVIRDDKGAIVDCHVIEANEAWSRHTGVALDEVIGRPRSQWSQPMDMDAFAVIARAIDSGVPIRLETFNPGLQRWIDMQIVPRGDRFACLFADITVRKQAELVLRASEERQAFLLRLSDALRSLIDPVAIRGEATRLLREHLDVGWCHHDEVEERGTAANAVREDLPPLAGVHELLDSSDIADLLHSGSVSASFNQRVVEHYAALGMSSALGAPLVKDGRLIAVLLVADTSAREWGENEVGLLSHVAERMQVAVERANAEAALRASEARLQLADRVKDEFLATLGHELRTPLAAIMLWGGFLRSGNYSPQEHARAVDAISESAGAQSRVIDDLLDLSRLMTGKLLLSPDSVAIEDVARAIVDVVRPTARSKDITLVIEAAPNLGRAILDAARLRQVLCNLLSNAIKFTPKGGTVTLSLHNRDGFLEAEIADTGEGIDPDFFPHLFERFRQADMGKTRQHGGLGIGLALCRQLVELQGGVISAHSDGRGQGATFKVKLPWVAPRLVNGGPAFSRNHTRDGRSRLRGVTVLLVEDDSNTLAAMESTLHRAGATVLAVRSGAAALDVLETADVPAKPLVLVSDLALPDMSGYELVERITSVRQSRGRPLIPACAVSARARGTDRRQAIEAGFDMYVPKPVTPEQLVGAVADLVQLADVAVPGDRAQEAE